MSEVVQTVKKQNGEAGLEEFGYKQELKRALTFKDLLFYGMVFMVPIAPMGIYGYVVDVSNGMAPVAYVIGIVAMIFTAFSYANMSRAYPIAGSVYSYASRAINPFVGFFAGWSILLDYILVPALVYLVAGYALQEMLPFLPYWGWIALFVVGNTIVNLRGIEITAKTNVALMLFEMAVLVAFIIMALVAIFKGVGAGSFTPSIPFTNPTASAWTWSWPPPPWRCCSFLGFDAISTLAEETKNPSKIVGKATVTALLLVGGLFVLQTYLASLVVPDHTAFNNPDTGFLRCGPGSRRQLAAHPGGPGDGNRLGRGRRTGGPGRHFAFALQHVPRQTHARFSVQSASSLQNPPHEHLFRGRHFPAARHADEPGCAHFPVQLRSADRFSFSATSAS